MSRTRVSDIGAAAVIPARYGSTRFPGKVLADLMGRPVLQWVYDGCVGSGLFSRVIVATDDKRVQRAAEGFGAEAIMTDTRHSSGTERVAEVAQSLNEDIIVNVQGDEPLVEAAVLSSLTDSARKPGVQVATPVTAVTTKRELLDPGVVKVVFNDRNEALYFSRWPIPFLRDSWRGDNPWRTAGKGGIESPETWWQHIGIYAFRRDHLLRLVSLPPAPSEKMEKLEQLRWLHAGISIQCVLVERKSMGIDTPADLERVRRILVRRDSA